MSTLYTGIAQLVTNDATAGDGSLLGVLTDAAFVVEDEHVSWVGRASEAGPADRSVDLDGRAVVPGFVDSHTHLVFAGDRSDEFVARMAGERYDGSGIAATVAATRAASDAELATRASELLDEARRQGTTTIEIKSGYGLTVADEERILRVAAGLTTETTFLGAHVVPPEYAGRRDAYVDLVVGDMLAAARPHARWIDVFCDIGAFDEDEARTVLAAGAAAGLAARLHGNQLAPGAGASLAVETGCASVDHCTFLSDADVDALAASSTVATLLPAAEFSSGSPYPSARRLLDAGVTVAIATDCNPGSSFTTSMPLCVALAVRELGMSPAEALWSATAGGAAALRRDDVGVLRPGARADFAVLDAPSFVHLAYRPGVPLVSATFVGGAAEAGRRGMTN